MKSQIVSIFIDVCIASIWLIPAICIIKFRRIDDRFLCRQWLFPLQFWLQILFEKMTGNRRTAVRILQIFSPYLTFHFFLVIFLILQAFHEPYSNHTGALYFLIYYLLFGGFAYWFQPKKGKVYRTK